MLCCLRLLKIVSAMNAPLPFPYLPLTPHPCLIAITSMQRR